MEKNKNDKQWWDYVTKAHASCYKDFTEDCSKAIHKKVGISWEDTSSCVDKSFVNRGTVNEDNSILGEDFEYWMEDGFTITPSVMINDVKYNGDIAPDYVFEAICASFKDRPVPCMPGSNQTFAEMGSKHVTFNWLLLIAIVLVILNVILVAFCIRRNKTQLQTHVFSAMGKYSKVDRKNDSEL